ncbi:hypothetical protein [Aliagarivorans marinus]|uniref:hypothetical protein n=1 Tax=Aliagarivorans marinus TaxID=561965 RepID=UPI0004298B0D|nr:hypothetical protein [Aliagarivorans marinus]
MSDINIADLMRQSAKDASDFALQEYSIELNGSLESVALVSALVQKLNTASLDDQQLFTLSYMFGAYLGEVYIRELQGAWLYEEETEDEPPQTFLVNGEYKIAFPSKVYHALVGSDSQELDEYFCELLAAHKEMQ